MRFALTDTAHEVNVTYSGILPDLFREGRAWSPQGTLAPDGSFRAREVLAKHDENYMPQGGGGRAEEGGHWQKSGQEAAAR